MEMAGERKFVWFNSETEKDLYEEAKSMQFSTEVKKWIRQRIIEKSKQKEVTQHEQQSVRTFSN